MPHLSSMVWNHDDELREVTVGTETVSFQYAGGMRSRKYTQKGDSVTTEERIYLGAFEIYRKRISGDLDLERESLHISDGTGRICIVETKTVEDEEPVSSPVGIWRYQLGNHLGSAATEVDESGEVISYEEYHPYGTSAYRAVDSSVEVSAKRYRYTGMERDEETGLAYHSARYLVPWLGRWTAADPIGLSSHPNRYQYAALGPATHYDLDGNSAMAPEQPASEEPPPIKLWKKGEKLSAPLKFNKDSNRWEAAWTIGDAPDKEGEFAHVAATVNPDKNVGPKTRMEAQWTGEPVVSQRLIETLNNEIVKSREQLDALEKKLENPNLTPESRKILEQQRDDQKVFVERTLPERQAEFVEYVRKHETTHLDIPLAVAEGANKLLKNAKTEEERDAIIAEAYSIQADVQQAQDEINQLPMYEQPKAWGAWVTHRNKKSPERQSEPDYQSMIEDRWAAFGETLNK
jgi:RHS repeat-associated protein